MIKEKVSLLPFHTSDPSFDAVVRLFSDSFFDGHYSDSDLQEAKENILKHSKRPGFRGITAFDGHGEVIGFIYGYVSLPGQFYHNQLKKALDPEAADEWLTNSFELVELAVDKKFRRRGVGSHLHDALLGRLPCEKAILTVGKGNETARRFYLEKGWEILAPEAVVIPGIEPQTIMVKRLKDPI